MGANFAAVMDRRREREARARGDEFRRYTYRDVFDDPKLMLAELEKLLGPGATLPPAECGHARRHPS
jgi:hypothetical protein